MSNAKQPQPLTPEEVLRRMLSTPHSDHQFKDTKPKKKPKKKAK